MKIVLLWITFFIGITLIKWACEGNGTDVYIKEMSLWWAVPVFIFCFLGVIQTGYAIITKIF